MAAKFQLNKTATGRFYFNLKAANGEVILSSEVYESKGAAENGIASVKTNAALDARYERKTSVNQAPYFVLKAANQQIIGRSEMYSSASACEHGIASVKMNAAQATRDDLTAD